jgi:group I intron endonuclease
MIKKTIVGVYKITCLANNKIYVGSSSNIYMRWYRHISNLKYNRSNPNLQNSYNKYGKDSLKFEIIEQCEEKYLIEREIYWAETIKNDGFEIFNVGEFIESPTRGIKLSENHKNKLRQKFEGEKNPSYQKIWVHKGEDEKYIKKEEYSLYEKDGYIKGLSNSHKTNISLSQKEIGRKMTEYNKIKLKESNIRPKSEKHKLNLSISKKKSCGVKVLCLETGEVFDSYTDAAIKFNTSYQAIRQAIIREGKCAENHFKKI